MGITNQARHLRGTPASMGGKFAPDPRSAAEIDEIDVDPWSAPDPVAPAYEPPEEPAQPAMAAARATDFGDVEALVGEARRRSRNMASRWSLDADDLQQEALLQFLEAQAKAEPSDESPNGRSFPDTEHGRIGYLQVSMRNVATAMATNGAHSSNRAAWRELHRRRAQMEQELGRHLSTAEIDALAERIRAERPANQQPVMGFHRLIANPEVAINWAAGDTGEDATSIKRMAERSTAGTDEYFANDALRAERDFDQASTAARVAGMLEAGGKANSVAARHQAWNAISEISGAPLARHEQVKPEDATAARRAVADAGGPRAFLRAWARSEQTDEAAEAFFAPFGGSELDLDGRHAVVESMSRYPERAADLWDGALSYATISRRRTAAGAERATS